MYETIIAGLRTILSPPRCAHCRMALRTYTPLCELCTKKIEPIATYDIHFARITMSVHAASAYDGPLRALVLQKHASNSSAAYALAQYILDRTPFLQLPGNVLIPIPLHWTRHYSRGFNQAHLIATHLARHKSCTIISALSRCKRTAFQSSLNRAQRTANVTHAFKLNSAKQDLADKHIVLIDDLMTSGSTLYNAARCLLPCNPASITAVVACRARPH